MSTEPRHLGKYELRERLARGGQGEVWKAFDTQLRRYVAIKQLHANLQSDPDFTSRFEREARFIASLHHSNIVQIHDFQLVHTPDSDTTTAYMVMDYIEGPTLADYFRNTSRKGQFPAAADVVYIFTAVSLAIDYAHEKGMIHRDIKPANIILDQRFPKRNAIGSPILTDFGIAKLQGVSADTTKVLGTPLYVSPEQAQGLAGDKRSDLYSLGIILYEMTTGVTPFRGDSVMAILMQHFQEIPTLPALINPNISPGLSEVILKSIAKDPSERFPSASDMAIAVAESLNVVVPAELIKPNAPSDINRTNSYNPLQPTQAPGMTPTPLTPFSFQSSPPPIISLPSAFTPATNDRQTPLTEPADSRPGSLLFQNPDTIAPTSIMAQSSQVSPPAVLLLSAPQPPARQRRTHIVLISLLVAAVVGSVFLFAFFALDRTTTPSPSPSNSVVGHVRFLSSPNAPRGSLDEVEITIQHIPDAPPVERYYAWLQINSESLLPIHWLLTTQNGRLSSSPYINPFLLKNKPYLFLITVEKANTEPQVATLATDARLYYAILPANIQNLATFVIRPCPQGGTTSICMS
jgi:eukaryotic-like serine/threonine-protein kinase